MSAEPEVAEGFKSLFDAHFDDLWRFARRRCLSGDAADDVVAQVFAVAWRRRDDLPISAERLWLFGVARRVLANERRSTTRQERLRSKLAANEPDLASAHLASADVANADVVEQVPMPSLAALSTDEREAVQLRYWDDLTVTEIAELLGCTANAVSLRLHKARRKLLESTDRKDLVAEGHVAADPDDRREELDERQ